jgi:hypothetical protein
LIQTYLLTINQECGACDHDGFADGKAVMYKYSTVFHRFWGDLATADFCGP